MGLKVCVGLIAIAVGCTFAAAASATVSFNQATYTVHTFCPGPGCGPHSAIGSPTPGSGEKPIAIADMNGDGKPDIIATDYQQNQIYVLLNNGDGTFRDAPGSPFSNPSTCHQPRSLLPGEFNGDHNTDVLVECYDNPADGGNPAIELFPGQGDGRLGAPTASVRGYGPMAIAKVEDNDLLFNTVPISECTIDTDVFAQGGDVSPQALCQGGGIFSGSTAHWNTSACGGDEWLGFSGGSVGTDFDITIYAGAVDMNPVNGCDTFSSSSHDSGIPCCSVAHSGVTTADLNNDGTPDIVMSTVSPGSFYTVPVTTTSVGSPTAVSSLSSIVTFGVADFNGDGLDLAGAEYSPSTGQTLIAIHQGEGSTSQFDAPQAIPVFGNTSNSAYPQIAIADLNGDGKPDIVTSGVDCNAAETSCDNRITVLLDTTPAPAGGGGSGGGSGGNGGSGGGGSGGNGGGGAGSGVFPGLKLHSQTLTVLNNGAVQVSIGCPPGALVSCVGTDVLTSLGAIAVSVTHKEKRLLTFGSKSFSIPAGHTGQVTMKLSKTALKLLARKHRLKVLESVTGHDNSGGSKTTTTTLTLKSGPKRRH